MIWSTIKFTICSCLPVLSTSFCVLNIKNLSAVPTVVVSYTCSVLWFYTCFLWPWNDFIYPLHLPHFNPGVIIFGKAALISWFDLFALIFCSQSIFADKYTSHYSIIIVCVFVFYLADSLFGVFLTML